MKYARISVITPSFNQGEFIERTVRSVLCQRYPNLEYILMDGGSIDSTLQVLEAYRSRFAHFVSAPDGGQADAIASGFERSTGEIMTYLNSDDVLAPGTLHFVSEFFQKNRRIDFIYSHRVAIDEQDKVIWYWGLPRHVTYLMRRWDFIPQETCFWRRRLFERAGNIDRSFTFAMDYDLFVRFMAIGRFCRVERILAAFRVHDLSKTSARLESVGRQEMKKVWQKHEIAWRSADPAIQQWFVEFPPEFGRIYATSKRFVPGGFPGIGYDFNEVWGGLLRRKVSEASPLCTLQNLANRDGLPTSALSGGKEAVP